MIRPTSRSPVRKSSSAKRFRKQAGRTKALNAPGLARGGFRL